MTQDAIGLPIQNAKYRPFIENFFRLIALSFLETRELRNIKA